MIRRCMVAAALLLASLAVFASGQAPAATPEGPYELSVSYWFGQPALADAVKQAASDYMKKYPQATVKVEHIPYETYWQKIPAMAVAKQLPDVVQIASILKYTMGRTNSLVDLKPFIDKDPTIKWDQYFDAAKKAVTYEGQIIQLPYGLAASVFVFNLDMYKAAGLANPGTKFTWDQMLANAQKLTKKDADGNVIQWGFYKNGPAGQHSGGVPNFILQNGGKILTDDLKKAAFDTPEGREALQFWVDMTLKYKVMPRPTEAEGLGDLFQAGKVGQFHEGQWLLPDYKKSAKFDWDLRPLPSKKIEASISDVGGAGFSMARNTKNPQAAWELLKMVNNTLAALNADSGGEFPCDPALFDRWQSAAGPPYARKEFLEWNLKYGVPRAITPGFLQWRREWQDEMILALNGEKTVAVAMKEGARKVNAVLDEQW